MPWDIVRQDGRFCVRQTDDDTIVGCHDTQEDAERHLSALRINVGAEEKTSKISDRTKISKEIVVHDAGEGIFYLTLLHEERIDKQGDFARAKWIQAAADRMNSKKGAKLPIHTDLNHETPPLGEVTFLEAIVPEEDVEVPNGKILKGDLIAKVEAEEEMRPLMRRAAGGSLQGTSLHQLVELEADVPEVEDIKALLVKQPRDPAAVCGAVWFNGTEEQRSAFGGGTEGRSREEQPPAAWWNDCIASVTS